MNNSITDVEGIAIGHWTDAAAATGCTVVLCPAGAVAGVDVRGGSPGTRETDLLRPECTVDHIHAVLLAGGSAFGLAAADGVVCWLEERGHGFPTGICCVPIVPAAVVFDLPVARADVRPGPAAGYAACDGARGGPVEQGNVGAGTGCTIGKASGLAHACKGGVGTASLCFESGLTVGALAVVNAWGNVHDPGTGAVVAGTRRVGPAGEFLGFEDPLPLMAGRPLSFALANTTLAVIATNARLTKSEVTKVAQMGHDGFARAIRPVHTTIDGDVVFALATCELAAHVDVVGAAAADAVAQAIVNAARAAAAAYGLPAARDLIRPDPPSSALTRT
jgi:L-aminopeptidase/D-esterase-like protein